MVGVDQGVALTLSDILLIRQFGTGDDIDAALGDDFAAEDLVV